jgi:hypothetical protein
MCFVSRFTSSFANLIMLNDIKNYSNSFEITSNSNLITILFQIYPCFVQITSSFIILQHEIRPQNWFLKNLGNYVLMVVARPWLIMIQHWCNPMRPPQDPITAIQYTLVLAVIHSGNTQFRFLITLALMGKVQRWGTVPKCKARLC